MRLGVISDTHDKLATIGLALGYFSDQQVDVVVHCGDWKSIETVRYFAEQARELSLPVRGVLGNNDLEEKVFLRYAQKAPGDFELHAGVLEMQVHDNTYVAAYHGHHKPTLRNLLTSDAYQIILLGHTHKPKIENNNNKLIVNPGSTAFSIPRSKTWLPSVAMVDTSKRSAELAYLA